MEETESPRDISFCNMHSKPKTSSWFAMALADERFTDDPLVIRPPYPLLRRWFSLVTPKTDGALGAICVIDYKPRELTGDQKTALTRLRDRSSATRPRNFPNLAKARTNRVRVEAELNLLFSHCHSNMIFLSPASMILQTPKSALEKALQ